MRLTRTLMFSMAMTASALAWPTVAPARELTGWGEWSDCYFFIYDNMDRNMNADVDACIGDRSQPSRGTAAFAKCMRGDGYELRCGKPTTFKGMDGETHHCDAQHNCTID
jgi:hypothetical protein